MKVLKPIELVGLHLRNAIAVSPMSRMQANENGTPSEEMTDYYVRFASSGAGLVFSEAIYVDETASRAYFRQPGLATHTQADGWSKVTSAVQKAGGRIFAQLQHAGRLAESGLNRVHLSSVAGTAAGNTWQTNTPNRPARAATSDEIQSIVQAFASSAQRALESGFDGVEIHGARGYLLDDFLSASTNKRDDEYGGSLDGRLKFLCEVVSAVRTAIGSAPLSVNLSLYKMDDVSYQPPGGKSEIVQIARTLRSRGADILHVSTRGVLRDEAWGTSLAATVKSAVTDCAIIANGGIRTLENPEAAISATGASMVAVARAYLANPDWLDRVCQGLPLKKYTPGLERRPLLESVSELGETEAQLFAEDFKPGQKFGGEAREINDDLFVKFASMTGDAHPIHYDDAYAARSRYGRRLAHGLLVSSMAALGATPMSRRMEEAMVAFVEQGCRFIHPVFIGDSLSSVFEVETIVEKPKRSAALVRFDVHLVNGTGQRVMEGYQVYLLSYRPKGF